MSRRPEIGNVQLYPDRPLKEDEKNGYVLKFFCPIRQTRIRRNCGTRDRREARRILRECQERLLNGKYVESNGAITIAIEQATTRSQIDTVLSAETCEQTWQKCFDEYYKFKKERCREKSLTDAASRIAMVGRIFDAYRAKQGLKEDGPLREYASLAMLEYAQERLLAGDEGRYDSRAPTSVNTTLGAVTAFFHYCKDHSMLDGVPTLGKLSEDEVMKGRPISEVEFTAMLDAVPEVVGDLPSASWRFVLKILWESAFRVDDLMNFSWDNKTKTHPIFPDNSTQFPTIMVSSRQKNKKSQEIPMLPGLKTLLETIPPEHRHGWIANPIPTDGNKKPSGLLKPVRDDLATLAGDYSNSSIGRAFGVSEAAVRKWLINAKIERDGIPRSTTDEIPQERISSMQLHAKEIYSLPSHPTETRLTKEHVGRVISSIGEKARIVVQHPDEVNDVRIKYASAHDLRRSCAYRLINAGVSAETLRVLLRHEDFKTTERFYGAVRAAQSAAHELNEKITMTSKQTNQNGGMEKLSQLSPDQISKLLAFLNSI